MASNQTSNYGLSQWEATDKVLREEFNQDNAKIDAALAQEKAAREEAVAAVAATVTKIVWGSYTGNGAASKTISLGFTPQAVLLAAESGYFSFENGYYGGLALLDRPVTAWSENGTALKIVEGGFTVFFGTTSINTIATNTNGRKFYYLAFA